MKPIKVAVFTGSANDLPVLADGLKFFEEMGIPFELVVASAHRTPDLVEEKLAAAERAGCQVVIAAAGHAAHLAGVIAGKTLLPVIGLPIGSSSLNGMDALLSTAQMPGGIPVATMAIGKGGALNAAILATQILALADPKLLSALGAYRAAMREKILNANRDLENGGWRAFVK